MYKQCLFIGFFFHFLNFYGTFDIIFTWETLLGSFACLSIGFDVCNRRVRKHFFWLLFLYNRSVRKGILMESVHKCITARCNNNDEEDEAVVQLVTWSTWKLEILGRKMRLRNLHSLQLPPRSLCYLVMMHNDDSELFSYLGVRDVQDFPRSFSSLYPILDAR